jgi:hypothetical protein
MIELENVLTIEQLEQLGGANNIECSFEAPLNIKLSSMDLKSTNLMCGQNGIGKSVLNKLIYFSSMVAYMHIDGSLKQIEGAEMRDKIQSVFNGVFDMPKELSGFLKCEFERGLFECRFLNGEILTGHFTCEPQVKRASYPKYLSTVTRNFTTIEAILDYAKLADPIQLTSKYKLYDVMACYMMNQFARSISDIPIELIEQFKNFEIDLIKLEVDDNDKFVVTNSLGRKQFATSLSSGHQALIIMIISSIL